MTLLITQVWYSHRQRQLSMFSNLTAVTNFWGTSITWASIYRTIRSTAGQSFSKTQQLTRTPPRIRRSRMIRSTNTRQMTLSAHRTSRTTKSWSSLPTRRTTRGQTLSSWQGIRMTLQKCARCSRSSAPQTESIFRQLKKKTQASALTWSACSTISRLRSSFSSPRATQGSARRVCGARCSPFRLSPYQSRSALAMKICCILTTLTTRHHPIRLKRWRASKSTILKH